MATRQMKATNYFSHDSNARNDEKIIRLRMKHHAAGYGVYFMILERLREEVSYMSAKDYNMIAFDLRVDAALVKSVVEDFGLFAFTDDGKCFYSDSFTQRMNVKDTLHRQRSEAGKAAMKKRWKKKASSKNTEKDEQENTVSEKETVVIAHATHEKTSDNEKWIERFFAKSNKANIEVLLMNFGMKPDDTPVLRSLAKEVVTEWDLSDKRHTDYTDWSQHLISTMRIKWKDKQPKQGRGKSSVVKEQSPTSEDYLYGGGFGSKDV